MGVERGNARRGKRTAKREREGRSETLRRERKRGRRKTEKKKTSLSSTSPRALRLREAPSRPPSFANRCATSCTLRFRTNARLRGAGGTRIGASKEGLDQPFLGEEISKQRDSSREILLPASFFFLFFLLFPLPRDPTQMPRARGLCGPLRPETSKGGPSGYSPLRRARDRGRGSARSRPNRAG